MAATEGGAEAREAKAAPPRTHVPTFVTDQLRRLPDPLARTALDTVRQVRHTRFVGLVAEVAFFAAAGIVPLGLAALAFVGHLDLVVGEAASSRVEDTLRRLALVNLNREAATRAVEAVRQLFDAGTNFLLYTLAITIVFSSRGFAGALRALTHMFGAEGHHGVWRDVAATVVFTVAAAMLATLAILGVLLEPVQGNAFVSFYTWGRWLILPAGLVGWLTSLYHYARPDPASWARELPGALFGAAGISVAAVAYAAYLERSPALGLGPLLGPALGAALATFSLVFFLAAFVLLGGALNAVRAGAPRPR
ncbi:MAG TPA: YhjD/YihY/BrkB family envelope integrity protein [Nitriliruptorales bacterium]|nr:YhjD/YihY/BrkB family envelope integrity protein [Nitriliruptorales bacterium]